MVPPETGRLGLGPRRQGLSKASERPRLCPPPDLLDWRPNDASWSLLWCSAAVTWSMIRRVLRHEVQRGQRARARVRCSSASRWWRRKGWTGHGLVPAESEEGSLPSVGFRPDPMRDSKCIRPLGVARGAWRARAFYSPWQAWPQPVSIRV